ncbi:hypothetical protein A4S06_11580 [Erysipelotrichaceae bacterium MTC7]|nr:hypothetical protein A4S06_11580 [Erysipelotrichaceae bacterium MTC7]
MKKLKYCIILVLLAFMCIPTVVLASNAYYSDSYMMYRYADENPSGSNCTAITEHNQRYANATAGIYHYAGGAGHTQTKGPGTTARVSLYTNRYNHVHTRK